MLDPKSFFDQLKKRPELGAAYLRAVDALVRYQATLARNESGLLATFRLKKLKHAAVLQMGNVISAVDFLGRRLTEDEKQQVLGFMHTWADIQLMGPAENHAPVTVSDIDRVYEADEVNLDEVGFTEERPARA